MEKKQYSWAEVAQNNGANGARTWIVLWGTVYDVTDYMEQHPGGSELISEYAGMDATTGFDDFGHSSDAKKMLKKYEIGVIQKVQNEKSKNKKNKETNGVTNSITEKNVKNRERRKYLRVILGPCASA